jgi:hypothetical protein
MKLTGMKTLYWQILDKSRVFACIFSIIFVRVTNVGFKGGKEGIWKMAYS